MVKIKENRILERIQKGELEKKSNLLKAEDLDDYPKLSAFLNVKELSVSFTGQTYRIINHWENAGLLDDNRESENGWRKYSPSEIIWIKIIYQLREFGFSIDKIKEVKKYVIGTQKQGDLPRLHDLLIGLLFNDYNISLIVYPDGISDLVTLEKYEEEFSGSKFKNHIRINLFEIVCDLFSNIEFEDKINPSQDELNDEEIKLLFQLRTGNFESITINLEGKKIKQIHKTEIVKDVWKTRSN